MNIEWKRDALYPGYALPSPGAVFQALHADAYMRTTPENVQDVLEAVRRIVGAAPASAQPDRGAAQTDERCACGTHTKRACDFAGSCGKSLRGFASSPASQPVAPEAAQGDAIGHVEKDALQYLKESTDAGIKTSVKLYSFASEERGITVPIFAAPVAAVAPSDAKGKADDANAGGETLAILTLGGIDGEEYDDNDIEIASSVRLEELQQLLVRTADPVVIELVAKYPATSAACAKDAVLVDTGTKKGPRAAQAFDYVNKVVAEKFRATDRAAVADAKWQADAANASELPKQGAAHALAVSAGFAYEYERSSGVHHYRGYIEQIEKLIAIGARTDAEGETTAADAKDAARLDLLLNISGFHFEIIGQKWHLLDARGRIAGIGATKRDAIDAAMAAAPSSEKGGAK